MFLQLQQVPGAQWQHSLVADQIPFHDNLPPIAAATMGNALGHHSMEIVATVFGSLLLAFVWFRARRFLSSKPRDLISIIAPEAASTLGWIGQLLVVSCVCLVFQLIAAFFTGSQPLTLGAEQAGQSVISYASAYLAEGAKIDLVRQAAADRTLARVDFIAGAVSTAVFAGAGVRVVFDAVAHLHGSPSVQWDFAFRRAGALAFSVAGFVALANISLLTLLLCRRLAAQNWKPASALLESIGQEQPVTYKRDPKWKATPKMEALQLDPLADCEIHDELSAAEEALDSPCTSSPRPRNLNAFGAELHLITDTLRGAVVFTCAVLPRLGVPLGTAAQSLLCACVVGTATFIATVAYARVSLAELWRAR